MKWIKDPIELTGYYESMLALNQNDINILRPVLKRALSEYRKIYEKYEDIRQGGEATERQLNLLMKYSEIVSKLECFIKLTEI